MPRRFHASLRQEPPPSGEESTASPPSHRAGALGGACSSSPGSRPPATGDAQVVEPEDRAGGKSRPGYIFSVDSHRRARAIFLSEQAGLIPPHELPDLATELLVLGYDTPSLRELAGLPTGDRAESADLWNAVRDELGIRREEKE